MQATELGLIPAPGVVQFGSGHFVATATVRVNESVDPELSAEGYVLDVTGHGVDIRGGGSAGVFYGRQTLRQLLPPQWAAAVFTADEVRLPPGTRLPHLHIEDAPAYPWRGFMLDVARHFFSVPFLLKLIDQLAAHKLNVLHLHLTDDQGWRIPIPGYPRLTTVGSQRGETVIGFDTGDSADARFDGTPHGGSYTRAELEQVVAYAGERHITVLPEVDLPGHVTAALAAYPELGSGEPTPVRTRWGISTRILALTPETMRFVSAVLAELAAVFPGSPIHLGGDEAPKREWRASAAAQERIRALGLASEEHLQGWFTAELGRQLHQLGRKLVAWDEVVTGNAPRDTVVMAWRSSAHGVRAALAGYDVVMSASKSVYFDHRQSDGPNEPVTFPGSPLPLSQVFAFEPTPQELRDQAGADTRRGRILGAQAHLWTEYVPTSEHAEYMIFPRLCAFAEAAWRVPLGPDEQRNFPEFRRRLTRHLPRLVAAGLRFRPVEEDTPPQQDSQSR